MRRLRSVPQPGRLRRPKAILSTVALAVVVALFLVAFFGDDGFNVMTPADVQASTFVYTHARPGPLMSLTQNFPDSDIPRGIDSDKFASVDPLSALVLRESHGSSPAAIPFLTNEIVSYGGGVTAPGYFLVSPSMLAYAEEYGLATAAQCHTFLAAMDRAPGWRILYSHGGATVYELAVGP